MKSKAGRPTVMTPITIGKLEEIFAMDGTIREACTFAGIHVDTYYEFLKKNPEYTERFEALRENPVLKARRTIMEALTNPQYATWYIERKKKKEFALRQELTGADGEALAKPALTEDEKNKLLKLLKK